MEDLRDLYQEVILDHNKNPRNFHKMDRATKVLDSQNPLCGDHKIYHLKVPGVQSQRHLHH
jgi:nitrogen fixation NifU-like protein